MADVNAYRIKGSMWLVRDERTLRTLVGSVAYNDSDVDLEIRVPWDDIEYPCIVRTDKRRIEDSDYVFIDHYSLADIDKARSIVGV